jgi:hypothetical protein
MNNKTLALLFVTAATVSFSAHATVAPTGEDKPSTNPPKKPTCMQELLKGKSVQANMTASIKCQERAIGRLAMSGVLDGDGLKDVLDKQKEFDKAFNEANKDKKITAEEKKELQELKKAAASAVFETAWNEDAMKLRLERLKKSIYAGETKGQLTAGEMVTLVDKYNELEAKFTKLNSGGLSTEDKKKLRDELSSLSKQVYDDKRDHEGNVAPTADREKDTIDETRRNLAASVVACFSDAKNTGVYWKQFTQLQAVQTKESRYLADGVLSKEERADLSQLYKQAKMDIGNKCGEKKAIKSDDKDMKPKDQKPVDDSGMKPAGGPKSDTPADPSHDVKPAN